MRNTNEKKIEEYTSRESEIKTNAQKDEIFEIADNVIKQPELINTQDILEKLKKLKEDLENETFTDLKKDEIKVENVEENNIDNESIKLTDDKSDVKINEKSDDKSDTENIKEEPDDKSGTENIKEEPDDKSDIKNIKEEPISVSKVIEKAIQQNEVSPQSIEQLMQEYRKMEEEVKEENDSLDSENVNGIDRLEDSKKEQNVSFDEMYKKLFGTLPVKQDEEKAEQDDDKNNAVDIVKSNISMFEDIPECKKQPYKFIGIIFNTYIIIEMDKEMYIIDQHAAHERILYEKVKKNYYSENSKDSQMLLLPDIINLTHKEMDVANENMDMFRKAGFDLEEFGENTIKLTGVPTICINLDNKDLFLETLDEINTVARTAKQEKEEKFIATVACKAAVKANMVLTTDEVLSLVDKMLELPNPFSCPHGRPTAIKMSKYDIERKFARK